MHIVGCFSFVYTVIAQLSSKGICNPIPGTGARYQTFQFSGTGQNPLLKIEWKESIFNKNKKIYLGVISESYQVPIRTAGEVSGEKP